MCVPNDPGCVIYLLVCAWIVTFIAYLCRHVADKTDVEEIKKSMEYSLMQEDFYKVSPRVVCTCLT